jgi:hypothetical protein
VSTTYWFRIKATNAGGASAYSNVVSATTQAANPTGNSTGLSATYFDNINFTGTTVHRTDATVNFTWGKLEKEGAVRFPGISVSFRLGPCSPFLFPVHGSALSPVSRTMNMASRRWNSAFVLSHGPPP